MRNTVKTLLMWSIFSDKIEQNFSIYFMYFFGINIDFSHKYTLLTWRYVHACAPISAFIKYCWCIYLLKRATPSRGTPFIEILKGSERVTEPAFATTAFVEEKSAKGAIQSNLIRNHKSCIAY